MFLNCGGWSYFCHKTKDSRGWHGTVQRIPHFPHYFLAKLMLTDVPIQKAIPKLPQAIPSLLQHSMGDPTPNMPWTPTYTGYKYSHPLCSSCRRYHTEVSCGQANTLLHTQYVILNVTRFHQQYNNSKGGLKGVLSVQLHRAHQASYFKGLPLF